MMDSKFLKASGYSLLSGSLVMIFTMVLHPSGGSMEKVLTMYKMIVVSHAMAVFSMPFIAFGFYGLSKVLEEATKLSFLALSFMAFALVSGIIAASINGFVLPFFVKKNASELNENAILLTKILQYGSNINRAMDYFFIAGSGLSIGIWSVLVILKKKLPKWFGWLGLLLILSLLVGVMINFNFINVMGFRVYVFGMAAWIICAGIQLIKMKFSDR